MGHVRCARLGWLASESLEDALELWRIQLIAIMHCTSSASTILDITLLLDGRQQNVTRRGRCAETKHRDERKVCAVRAPAAPLP